jgi:hypothetical protein
MTLTRFAILAGMILTAVLSKFLPHPANFAPIAAIALFSGANFEDRRAAFLVPLIALLIGDVITGLHVLIPFTYACFALNVCIGGWLRRKRTTARVLGGTLVGSILFFVVTNFGVWALIGTFPLTTAGLMACYVAGLPCFLNTVLGDLFYSAVLFGGLAFAESRLPEAREINVRVL